MSTDQLIQPKLSKAEQARLNGAKSKGPKTASGKARSARNAETNGAYTEKAVCINLLNTESMEAYVLLRESWSARLRPQCPVEAQLVDRIADCQWRLGRAIQHETAMLQHQMEIDAAEFDRAYACLTGEQREYRRSALAADTLRQTNRGLDYHLRIQSTLERQSQRLMKQLKDLRDNFPLNVAQPLPAPDLFGTPSFPEYQSNVDETNPTAPETIDNTTTEPTQAEAPTSNKGRLAQDEVLNSQSHSVDRVAPSPSNGVDPAAPTPYDENPTLPKAA